MTGRLAVCAAVVACWILTACGAPTSGEVQAVRDVPYDLMSPTSPATIPPTPQPAVRPRVFLVRDDMLVPVPASTPGAGNPSSMVEALMKRLALGPQEDERNHGLSSALGPDVGIALVRLQGTTAVVDVRAGDQLPSAGRLPLAVGQIVLTAVSVPGVERVQLTAEGKAVQAPLPDGALTDRPLSAADYSSLVAGAHPAVPAATPTLGPTVTPTGNPAEGPAGVSSSR